MKRAQSKLRDISAYPFFERVGRSLPNEIRAVLDWPTAARECTTIKWENSRIIARNCLQRRLERSLSPRYIDWNSIVRLLRPAIGEIIDKLEHAALIPSNVFEKIRNDIRWDLLAICMEYEYADLVEPPFCLPVLDIWYAAGHFPCGWDGEEFSESWDGEWMDGRLIVF